MNSYRKKFNWTENYSPALPLGIIQRCESTLHRAAAAPSHGGRRLAFLAELVTACCLPSMADGKSADEPNVDQWWTSTKMWPPGTCTNGPLFHLDVLQHQLGLQHLVLQLLLLLLLLLLHLLCYTAGPSSFLKLPLLFSLHISAPQFSLKPLPPLMPSASSLTQVENAENAREEACWALGVENTLVLSNFSLRGSSDHFQWNLSITETWAAADLWIV